MSATYSGAATGQSQPSSGILGGGSASTMGSTTAGPSITSGRSMWGQAGQQPSEQQQSYGMLSKARDWMQYSIENSSDLLRRYVNKYPPVAAYLFTLMLFSAIPVSIYTIFGLVSSTVLLTIALVGFAAIEGTILLASGGLLLTVLGTITFFTTLAFGFFGFVWLGYRSFRTVFGRVWEGAGYVTSTVGQKLQEQVMPTMSGMSSGGGGSGASGGMSGQQYSSSSQQQQQPSR